jgi:hypothetical protein
MAGGALLLLLLLLVLGVVVVVEVAMRAWVIGGGHPLAEGQPLLPLLPLLLLHQLPPPLHPAPRAPFPPPQRPPSVQPRWGALPGQQRA